jgi:hypothetical protein
VIIAIWVDDLIIFGKGMDGINKLKVKLNEELEMKDLGELHYFLGIQVHRNRKERQLSINQTGYINSILERFEMTNSKPMSTPIAIGTKLKKATTNDYLVDQKRYQSIVGSEMYPMLCTRPDIAYAISQVSQFNSVPTTEHEIVAKRILRYFNGTKDLGIRFDGASGLRLEAYSDSDWGASEDRRSISEYIFILAGGAISWQSKKQSTVASSSTEGEYMALLQAVKEIIWIQRFLSDIGREAENQDLIKEDNQGAIALAHNPQYHARTKHIDIQYHFVRECVENGKVRLEYCPTMDMVADGLTKALGRDRHHDLAAKMGLERVGAIKVDGAKHYAITNLKHEAAIPRKSGSVGISESSPAPSLPAIPADTPDGNVP